MKSLTKYLWFNAPGRRAYINISSEVEKAVKESAIKEGLCLENKGTELNLFPVPLLTKAVFILIFILFYVRLPN